jgi:hypothetical protein
MKNRHVTIGPEFFAKAKNDYECWKWALVREFMQNSIDCGSSTIQVIIEEANGDTLVTVINDGRPMSEETLINKLFALGESDKNFEEGNTGGFGKAKEILYFCHDSYEITSGKQFVRGSGADYTHDNKNEPYFNGTQSSIRINGSYQTELEEELRRFCRFAQYRGDILLNGTKLPTCLSKGSRRRDLGFGVIYTNKTHENVMVVRINGIPMFTQYVSVDRCVVVELVGISSEVLTSNRDGLVNPYREELSAFTTEIAVDKRSALKAKKPKYARFAGDRLSHVRVERDQVELSVVDLVDPIPAAPEDLQDGNSPVAEGININNGEEVHEPSYHENSHEGPPSGSRVAAYIEPPRVVATLGHEFIIKNETELVVPRYYRPDTGEFSGYSRKLVRMWGRMMVELHRMFDFEAEFAVGFIFDASTEAEYEDGIYGKVYYLNPATIVEQSSTYSKSFAKRFKLTERDRILAIAAHEFVHGLGYGWHDESYANKLTDVLGKVMKERKRFNWCFK